METSFDRNILGATLVRADQLRLGDKALLPTALKGVETATVTSLELLGDDVAVNQNLITSHGNTFLVLNR